MIYHTEENSQFKNSFSETFRELKLPSLLHQANNRKTDGFSVSEIFQTLLLLVFFQRSLIQLLKKNVGENIHPKNTYYRFLENDSFNWTRLLLLLAAKVTSYFQSLCNPSRRGLFVIDDSTIHRDRNKKADLLARTYDHVTGKYCKGFTLLTLGWTDGFSFIPPVLFNLLSSTKRENRYNEIPDRIDHRTNGYKACKESLMQKPDAVILMLERALEFGICAQYVLMDTWFTTAPLIQRICQLGLHVIGMVKLGNQRYCHQGKRYSIKQLYSLAVKHQQYSGVVLGSIIVTTTYGTPAKLVFVRHRSSKNRWLCLLSTDITLDTAEIVRLYGNRWSIECFFKASKSCLKLGREYQNRKYEVSVAHTAIVFTRYIILEWIRQKDNYDRTHGELFRMMCDEVSDMSIMEALASLLLLLRDGTKQFGKEYTESIKCKVTYWIGTNHRFYELLETVSSWES